MWDINRGIKVRDAKLLRRMVDARDDVKPGGLGVRGDGEISIDLLELVHKKAFNRRRLSSPTISDDYPITVSREREREVQKFLVAATTFKAESPESSRPRAYATNVTSHRARLRNQTKLPTSSFFLLFLVFLQRQSWPLLCRRYTEEQPAPGCAKRRNAFP